MAANTAGRRQSTRQSRNSTTRPLNYYARNFSGRGSVAGPSADNNANEGNPTQPGFFPAITHFTDAVDALPQEMVQHFSMLKEVEAKLHLPDEELRRLTDAIARLPPPPRTYMSNQIGRFPGLSAQNSIKNGSVRSVSAASTAAPQYSVSEQDSVTNPLALSVDAQSETERQQLFTQLRLTILAMIPMLDEKNAVLSTANHTLKGQLGRMKSSYKYIGTELSEEARYGSSTHWAYVTEKEPVKKVVERTRRENAGTNNFPAAAEDMAARSEARREAVQAAKKKRAQQQQQQHQQHQADSDLDETPAPKKGHKGKKALAAETADPRTSGLAVVNGNTAPTATASTSKKRKAPGGAAAPAMERSLSGAMRGALAASGRDTPLSDTVPKKRVKAAPGAAPKKRPLAIGTDSPRLASSPLVGTFSAKDDKKSHAARGRPVAQQMPAPSHLAEVLQAPPAPSAPSKPINGTTQDVPIDVPMPHVNIVSENAPPPPVVLSLSQVPNGAKQQDVLALKVEEAKQVDQEMTGVDNPTHTTIATTARSGRTSKAATPLTGTFPDHITGRNGKAGKERPSSRNGSRSRHGKDSGSGENSHASSEAEKTSKKRSRPTSTSVSSLRAEANGVNVHEDKGAANVTNPVATGLGTGDQHHNINGETPHIDQPAQTANIASVSQSAPTTDHKHVHEPETIKTSVTAAAKSHSRPTSSAKTEPHLDSAPSAPQLPPPPSAASSRDTQPSTTTTANTKPRKEATTASAPKARSHTAKKDLHPPSSPRNEDEEDDEADDDNVDPNEPRYCYCNDVSYGDMIACDNPKCPREWFHLACTELESIPKDPNWIWVCDLCKADGTRKSEKGMRR